MESEERQDVAKNVREVGMPVGIGFMLNDTTTVAASKQAGSARPFRRG